MTRSLAVTGINPRIKVDYDPAAIAILTPEIEEVIAGLLCIIERESLSAGINESTVDVDGFTSPDSERQRVVLTHWVDLSSENAARLWTREAEKYYAWSSSLPANLAKVAREQVGIAVAWDAPA